MSLRDLELDKAEELLEDDSQLAAWTEIFKNALHLAQVSDPP